MSASLFNKYQARWKSSGSLLCVGLDSDVTQLPDCVRDEANPIWEFNRRIIDATEASACAYKPNLAFYLSDGQRGLEALQRTVEYIPAEIPVILDCKVGDIGNTMEQYAIAFFDHLRVDAITLNPLMGADVMRSILNRSGAFAFALALTSNASARDFFLDGGMAEKVSAWIGQFPEDKIGAVVGATQSQDLKRMRELLPGRIFLIPGIGAQGGDLDSVLRHAAESNERPNILINSSRGIIFREKTPQFALAAGHAARELNELIIV
ncbi:MAG: orotidine-5'-phosphate decarboxylase [Candidatus Cloacimonadaceae bacterium]|nr:orotidine-5'-phosphate decarboxylase [Candidatus Cloacimonadota bacterium]MDX9949999.1 orotidine-5'-phosphate decarboxylase [Candidatus Syntrophosphaera sp.]